MLDDLPAKTQEDLAPPRKRSRFRNILVPLSGKHLDWRALDQALVVAHREQGRLHGLHVVPSIIDKESHFTQAIQMEFDRRCQKANVCGGLMIEVGDVGNKICDRARWVDLVITSSVHPPGGQPLARLNSRFGTLVRCCPRPILAVPGPATTLQRAVLAYDGSPKAKEALALAGYLSASDQWNASLVVVTVVGDNKVTSETLTEAQTYLSQHSVPADYVKAKGSIGGAILGVADEYDCDLMLLGGYGFNPMWEVLLGSTVDQVLRGSQRPVFICR